MTNSDAHSQRKMSRPVRYIAGVFGVLIIVLGILQSIKGVRAIRTNSVPRPGQVVAFASYEDRKRGTRMKVPRDWKTHDDEWLALTAPGGINVRIGVQPTSYALDEYTKQNVSEMRRIHDSNPDISIVDLEDAKPTMLAGNRASEVFYTLNVKDKDESIKIRGWQVWTVRSGRVYLVTFTAPMDVYDSYLPVANEMVSSFEIVQ